MTTTVVYSKNSRRHRRTTEATQ